MLKSEQLERDVADEYDDEQQPKWWGHGPMPDDVWERVDALYEAQNKLCDVLDLVRSAIKDTPFEDNLDAYLVAPLRILAGNDHGYLSRDTNLDDAIQMLRGEVDW